MPFTSEFFPEVFIDFILSSLLSSIICNANSTLQGALIKAMKLQPIAISRRTKFIR